MSTGEMLFKTFGSTIMTQLRVLVVVDVTDGIHVLVLIVWSDSGDGITKAQLEPTSRGASRSSSDVRMTVLGEVMKGKRVAKVLCIWKTMRKCAAVGLEG
jgi:hypothetical protein